MKQTDMVMKRRPLAPLLTFRWGETLLEITFCFVGVGLHDGMGWTWDLDSAPLGKINAAQVIR
jgi:hypothetical protein